MTHTHVNSIKSIENGLVRFWGVYKNCPNVWCHFQKTTQFCLSCLFIVNIKGWMLWRARIFRFEPILDDKPSWSKLDRLTDCRVYFRLHKLFIRLNVIYLINYKSCNIVWRCLYLNTDTQYCKNWNHLSPTRAYQSVHTFRQVRLLKLKFWRGHFKS